MEPTSWTRYIRVLAPSTALLGRPRPSWRTHLTREFAGRGPDIADPIYSDAHPSQIGHINCVLFIGNVSQRAAPTILDGAITSAAPAAPTILDGAITSAAPVAWTIFGPSGAPVRWNPRRYEDSSFEKLQ
jgi:hypothetical protein